MAILLPLPLRLLRATWLVALPVLLAGCASLEELAPPPDDRTAATAVAHQLSPADLVPGRELYLRVCGGCHSVQGLRDYSPAKWDKVLPRMIGEARLTPDEARQLTAYVRATVLTPPATP
jgi:mono/diheme cytochrome c family protein